MTSARQRIALAVGALVVGAAAIAVVAAAGEGDDAPAAATDVTAASTPGTSTMTSPQTTGPTTTTAPEPTTTAPPIPPYRSSIEPVTAEELGSSFTPGRGCAEPDALRAVNLTHVGYDGAVHEGRIIVAASQAEAVVAVFGELHAARFPIERVRPVDTYGSDDQASMRANNTSGYNCRTVAGTSKLSNHALGLAIDVNPLHNPYVRGSSVDPPEGAPWADRSNRRPGMLYAGDPAVEAFGRHGWKWGGLWSSPDYQHFSTSGT